MEIVFRIVAVLALGLAVVAVLARPGPVERADSDLEERIAKLERENADLRERLRDTGSVPAPAPAEIDPSVESRHVPAASPEEERRLAALVESRVEERLGRLRKELEQDYGLTRTATDSAEGKTRTLEEVADEIGLTSYELEVVREHRETVRRETANLLKEPDETYEQFRERMKSLEDDPDAQAAFGQTVMKKMMMEGGIAKAMAIQSRHNKTLRERLGDEKYKKYRSLEDTIGGGSNVELNLGFRAGGGD